MEKRAVSGIMLMLLLISMLTLAFKIQPVKAAGTIYFRADGSVDPPTAPIQREGDIYTFTGNINESIIVERDNIIVDGAGYTLQGTGEAFSVGMKLSERSNVTIKNINIRAFDTCIELSNSLNNRIFDNNLTSSIVRQGTGMYLHFSNNNTISGNVFRNNYGGIYLKGSNYNTFTGNNISSNKDGILLSRSSYNVVIANNVSNNSEQGILVFLGFNNTISGNNVINNFYGISLLASSGDTLRNNVLDNNLYGLYVEGHYVEKKLSYFIKDIEKSNTVNGKPIYYWVNHHDEQVPLDAGFVALVNSTNMTVKNLTLKNNGKGIILAFTNNSAVQNLNATNNGYGIYLFQSYDNNITNNNIAENKHFGIFLDLSSQNNIAYNNITNNKEGMLITSGGRNVIHGNNFMNNIVGVGLGSGIFDLAGTNFNKFFQNNFIQNLKQASVSGESLGNMWDDGYPSGGNYWSDYGRVDLYRGPYQNETGSDEIADTPYVINADNRDRYPLMKPWTPSIGIRNVAVLDVTPSATEVYVSWIVNINVTVKNNGDYAENRAVSVYYNSTLIGTQNITIASRENITLTFRWDTIGVASGNYTVKVVVNIVLSEINITDNTLIDGIIKIKMLGDVNDDNQVNIRDIATAALAFGSYPSHPNWSRQADINQDDKVDIRDLVLIAKNFGKTYP